ncbi:MAG: ABC transporter substrate-binding protein [Lachnospiraceae bacterium]|nr:ABC transporter substrate-binding protein [Lachnospiraceae bacterium]
MKKFLALLLAFVLAAAVLAGCTTSDSGNEGAENKTTAAPKEDNTEKDSTEKDQTDAPAQTDPLADLPEKLEGAYITATPEMYSNLDLSKPVTIYLTQIGGKPNDWDRIEEKINERLSVFNTSLKSNFISWADLGTMYSLTLTSGEEVDLITTAPWCQMYTQAAQGNFYAFDEEFVEKYMSLTWKYQNHISFGETTVNGKMIAVSCNNEKPENKIVAIRQDIADKYGIDKLTNWDDYMNFMKTVAEKETPESGIFAQASSGSNPEVWGVYQQQYDIFNVVNDNGMTFVYSYKGETPKFEDIKFIYETDMWKDFCHDMKELADAGCWSRGALSNTTSDDDAFAALTGASIAWNGSVFNFMKQAEEAGEKEGLDVRCMAYDLTTDHLVTCEEYNNNDVAIAAASKNPERAAMVLDLLKMDTELNRLIFLGIEGEHYTLNPDNKTFVKGPKNEDYPANSVSVSWATHNGLYEEDGAPERETAMYDAWRERMVGCPTVTFVFDDSPVSEYTDAVKTIIGDYNASLQLGLVEDVDGQIEEMLQRCNDAGLEKIKAEIQHQYEAWLATR